MQKEMYNEMESYDQIKHEIDEWTMRPVNKGQASAMELIYATSGYAIEQHQWTNYHHLMEMTENKDIRELFAKISFQEEEHQSKMGSLVDPETTPMETSMLLEMTAINGFADAAQLEPDQTLKTAYDYMLLDHLTQAKSLSNTMSSIGTNPENVIKGQIEIREGRPYNKQFIPTNDLFKNSLNKNTADIMSLVHLHTLLANEEGLRNEFQMLRKMLPSQDIRRLYNLVTAVENEHVVMLGSLHDPMITPLEYAMINELMEVRNHHLGIQMATSDSAREAHEYSLRQDETHLGWLRDAYANIEKGNASKFQIPNTLYNMPSMSVNDYIDQVLEMQMNLMPKGMGFEKAA